MVGSGELSCEIKVGFPSNAGSIVNSWQTSRAANRTLSCVVGIVYVNTLSSISCIETYRNLHTVLQIFSFLDKQVELLALLYGSVLQNPNICAIFVIKPDFSRNACIWKQRWNKVWIKIQKMQQYADIYLLQIYSTCFGCHSTHHQEY